MAKRSVELNTGALVMTDHGTLGAARSVYDLALKHKLKPVLGLEGYFRDDDCPILAEAGIIKLPESDKSDAKITTSHYNKYYHFTIHSLDQTAYEALVRILSRTDLNRSEQHGQERKPGPSRRFSRTVLESVRPRRLCAGGFSRGRGRSAVDPGDQRQSLPLARRRVSSRVARAGISFDSAVARILEDCVSR